MHSKSSVSLRLILLIGFQIAIILGLAAYSYQTLHLTSVATQQMYRFQFLPIADLAKTLERSEDFTDDPAPRKNTQPVPSIFNELEKFTERYSKEWHVTYSNTDDVKQFREDLKESGQESLKDVEFAAFEKIAPALKEIKANKNINANITTLRQSLSTLLDVNIQYAKIGDDLTQIRTHSAKLWLLILTTIAVLLSILMGSYIHWTIAPRIRRLVAKVEKFREFGINEKIIERRDHYPDPRTRPGVQFDCRTRKRSRPFFIGGVS